MSATNDGSSEAQDRMLGSAPGAPTLGRGPAPDDGFSLRGCAARYMPELNVLGGIADYGAASGQPVTKHLQVEITPSRHQQEAGELRAR